MDENKMNTPEENNEAPVSDTAPAEAEASETAPVEESPFISLAEVEEKDQAETPEAVAEPEVRYVYRWDYEAQAQQDRDTAKQHNKKGLRNYAIVMSVALLAAIALLVGVLAIGGASPVGTASPLEELYAKCYPSYVAITVVTETGTSGAGSGIIMTSDGYIATNQHVVENAKSISVILHDGTTVEADYVDGDELNDIAIIKVAKSGLKAAKIGHSSETRVGEQVMAIGTPHSITYRGTMTSGYISATNRLYASQNDNGSIQKVVPLLQTDTSVNPGNSGGPLFNMKGEVIGIVCMKLTGLYEGMGFAIPIDSVIDMLYDIIDNGELTISNGGGAKEGAAIGITGMTVVRDTTYLLMGDSIIITVLNENGEICVENILGEYIPISDTAAMEEMGITDYETYKAPASGVRVIGTADGFDSAKKLKTEDIIITVNGLSCSQIEFLQSVIATCRVGDKLRLEIWRDGEILSVSVELGRSASME